jgi:hypothetical protein
MKKNLKVIAFAGLALLLFAVPSFATDTSAVHYKEPCALITELGGLLNVLKVLAFLGAAFILAGQAWTWITASEFKMDDAKKRGVAMLVGFTLLFGLGLIIQFLPGTLGCQDEFKASFGGAAVVKAQE